jgi:hypothetical protein
MAVCSWCNQEMTERVSCTFTEFHSGKVPVLRIPYRAPRRMSRPDGSTNCHDCAVESGGFHHPGCDDERCPACAGQLFSCGCRFDEDAGDEADFEEWEDELTLGDR